MWLDEKVGCIAWVDCGWFCLVIGLDFGISQRGVFERELEECQSLCKASERERVYMEHER